MYTKPLTSLFLSQLCLFTNSDIAKEELEGVLKILKVIDREGLSGELGMNLGIDYGTTTTLISFSRGNSPTPNLELLDIGGDRLGYQRSSILSLLATYEKFEFSIGYRA